MNLQMEEIFKKFVVMFTILAAAECEFPPPSHKSTPISTSDNLNKQITSNVLPEKEIFSNTNINASSDLSEFTENMMEYFKDVKSRNSIKLWPGIYFDKKNETFHAYNDKIKEIEVGRRNTGSIIEDVKEFLEERTLRIELAKSSAGVEEGRFFFFKGFKQFQNIFFFFDNFCNFFLLSTFF